MLFGYIAAVIYVAAAILTVVKKRQDHAREDLHRRWNRVAFEPALPDESDNPKYAEDMETLRRMWEMPSGSSAYRDSTK